MKNYFRAALVLGSLGCILGVRPAQAAGLSLELLGNGTYSMATGSEAPKSAIGTPGAGLNLNFHLGPKTAIQLGAHYITRSILIGTPIRSGIISGDLGFKFFLSNAFSIVLGGYYNNLRTNPMGLSTQDYGLALGLGLTVPLGHNVGFLISPVYHYALKEQTYATGTLKASEIIGMVGFVFGGGRGR
jgi:hypothetical protein